MNNGYRDLKGELNEHVRNVVKRYITADHSRNTNFVYSDYLGTQFSWKIDSDGIIEGQWERRWEHGGLNGGAVEIPAECIWDESALVAFEEKRAAEKQALMEKAKAKEYQADLERLHKLREKLGVK